MANQYRPNQSSAMQRAMYEQWLKTKSGLLGLGTGMIAEPIAGLNALMRGNPDLVDSTRERLTYGDASGLMPRSFRLPDAVTQGAEYFNQSADRLGELSPLAGAALRTAPAFVAAMAHPALRAEPVRPNGLRKLTKLAEKAEKAGEATGQQDAATETPEQKRLRMASRSMNNSRA